MLHIFTVTVETEHAEGKFLSREAIADLIAEELASAEPSELAGDEGTAQVTTFEVEHDDDAVAAYELAAKRARAARRREARKADAKAAGKPYVPSGEELDEMTGADA